MKRFSLQRFSLRPTHTSLAYLEKMSTNNYQPKTFKEYPSMVGYSLYKKGVDSPVEGTTAPSFKAALNNICGKIYDLDSAKKQKFEDVFSNGVKTNWTMPKNMLINNMRELISQKQYKLVLSDQFSSIIQDIHTHNLGIIAEAFVDVIETGLSLETYNKLTDEYDTIEKKLLNILP